MELGKRIAELRKSRGMTQEQLGERLGATRQAVSKWEAGKAVPDLDFVIKMGELFGVTMDDLILGREAPAPAVRENGPAPPQETEQKGGRRNVLFALCVALSAVGFGILCLCPLFAELYRRYVFVSKGSAFVNGMLYLWKWPLLGVLILGVTLFFGGIWGAVRAARSKK